jgi:hypothetical protein
MTENMKKFAEYLSTLDGETLEKINSMDQDELIAFAAEKGCPLTEADLRRDEEDTSLSMDELASTAGGGVCGCVVGGGGGADESKNHKICGCGIVGTGDLTNGHLRCFCTIAGGGESKNLNPGVD